MNEQTIGEMIVRLTGDGSSYQKMLAESVKRTEESAHTVEVAARRIEGFQRGLEGFAKKALEVLSFFGVASSLEGALEKWEKMEKGQIRLESVLKANGRAVEDTLKDYTTFSKSISEFTLTTKGATLGLIKEAEQLGLTGEVAKKVVRDSIALAAINDGEAGSYLRVAQAIQRGDATFVKHLLFRHQNITASEALARAQKQVAAGLEAATKIANTAGGQLERLKRSLGGLTVEVGGLVASGLRPVIGWVSRAVEQFKALPEAVHQTAVRVVLLLGVLVALPGILSTIGGILTGLGIKRAASLALQTAEILLWGAWKAAVLAAGLVVGVFSFAYTIFSGLLSLGTLKTIASIVATVLYTAAMVAWKVATVLATIALAAYTLATGGYNVGVIIAKIATWAWNAALAVANTLLTFGIGLIVAAVAALATLVAGIAAFGATVALIATPVLALGAALIAAYQIGRDLFRLMQFADTSGLSQVGEIFKEWYMILKDVVRVAAIDMPLAWKLLIEWGKLAWSQVKDIWPPLWNFIQEGFSTLWDIVTAMFLPKFKAALLQLQNELISLVQKIPDLITVAAFPELAEETKKLNDRIAKHQEATSKKTVEDQKNHLLKLFEDLKFIESDATKAQRENVNAVWDEVKKVLADAEKTKKDTGLAGLANTASQATKEIEKLDAALMGSTEALSRLATYRDRLNAPAAGESRSDASRGRVFSNQVSVSVGSNPTQTEILRQIRDLLMRQASKPPINLEPANLGG